MPTASSGPELRNIENGKELGAVMRRLMYSPKESTSGNGPTRGRYVQSSLSVGEDSDLKSEGICAWIKGRRVTYFPFRVEDGESAVGKSEGVVEAGGPIGWDAIVLENSNGL